MGYNVKDVGARIAQLRMERGMSQDDLASILGVSTKHMGNVERGEYSFSLERYLVLSEVFSVSLDYLFTGALDKPLNDCVSQFLAEGTPAGQEAVWKFLRALLDQKK